MTDYKIYYKDIFQQDLLNFIRQIPVEGNKHYNRNEFNIQYFFLTPNYRYLDIISTDRQGCFVISLFWTVLVDQVFYSKFQYSYQKFKQNTMYPKFIGNCTAPSLVSSQCGHNQHPRKILQAVNDYYDMGNKFDFDRKIFNKDEAKTKREKIFFDQILEQSKQVMKEEIMDYFKKYQPEISWSEFWKECINEI